MKLKSAAVLILVLVTPMFLGAQTPQELNDQLFEAVRRGDAAAVTALLDKGANVNTKYRYGMTLLFKAAERGHVEVTRVLLARGIDVTVKDSFYGATALSWALQNEHNDVVKLILAKDPASVDEVLLTGARGGVMPLVDMALAQGGVKPETLSQALAAVMDDKDKAAIADVLKKAGAVPPPTVDAAILQTYVGNYKSERGTVIALAFKDGKFTAQPVGQPPFALAAIDQTSFRPTAFDGMVLLMKVEASKVVGFTLKQGSNDTVFTKFE